MKKLCAITTVDITLSSFVVDAMRKLKKEGYDITLISSMSEEFFNKHKNEFHCINLQMSRGTNPIEMLKSIWAFYKIFRREQFDYIQYATPNASLYASVAAFMVGCPIRVYCQWGIRYVGFEGMKRKFFKVLEVLTCKLSTHIRPASQKNLLFAVSEGHYPEKNSTSRRKKHIRLLPLKNTPYLKTDLCSALWGGWTGIRGQMNCLPLF